MHTLVAASIVDMIRAFPGEAGGCLLVASFVVTEDEWAVSLFNPAALDALAIVLQHCFDRVLPFTHLVEVRKCNPLIGHEPAHEATVFCNDSETGDAFEKSFEFFWHSATHHVYDVRIVI